VKKEVSLINRILDFSEMPMDKQIAVGMLLPFIPIFIGESLFFVLLIVYRWTVILSFSISFSFSCGGIVLWYMWRDGVRREIRQYEPLNATLFWSKEKVTWENQMIIDRISLKNEATLRATKLDEGKPHFENPPVFKKEVLTYNPKRHKYVRETILVPYEPTSVKIGLHEIIVTNPELIENFLVGTKTTEVILHHNSFAPNGIPYKRIQFIHDFPYQDDFYPCPDQWVVHQAQVLGGASAVIGATFLFWGERGEPIPVFKIQMSPALADITQIAVGIKPMLEESTEDNEYGRKLRVEISEAIKMGDSNQAMALAQILKARTNTLQAITEGRKDVEDLALAVMGEWEANEREIEDISPFFDPTNWKHILIAVFGTSIIALGVWWFLLR